MTMLHSVCSARVPVLSAGTRGSDTRDPITAYNALKPDTAHSELGNRLGIWRVCVPLRLA